MNLLHQETKLSVDSTDKDKDRVSSAKSANVACETGDRSFVAFARGNRAASVEQGLNNVEWPEQFPLKEEDFQRIDELSDSLFYESARFVTYIDDPAIAALTKYYSKVSHFPPGYKQDQIVGLGINEEELKQNPVR
ncbi:hypothetical protein RJ640_021617 [Escallonia rubra]|uniref:Uncharacterized protein n=1 Tax=Escallonia rubra TaxID=112253 RepID=A0AA88RLT1_9ASTE|nr:hypothetical protein RJ640_021617 [Escallonia rubra]